MFMRRLAMGCMATGLALLCGCSSLKGGIDITDSAHAAPATIEAEGFSFTSSLESSYDSAKSCMLEQAGDAQLLAVRTSGNVSSDHECSWVYLFASQEQEKAFSIFFDGDEPYAVEFGDYALESGRWRTIPSDAAITLDADEAFERAAPLLSESDEVDACAAYLMTYVATNDDPYEKSMTWYFEFYPSESQEAEGEDEASSEIDPVVIAVPVSTGVPERLT